MNFYDDAEVDMEAFWDAGWLSSLISLGYTSGQGRIQERFEGQTHPPFWKNFCNLLGFFEKKIPKPPKFFRRYKKNSNPPPRKICGYAPASGDVTELEILSFLPITQF